MGLSCVASMLLLRCGTEACGRGATLAKNPASLRNAALQSSFWQRWDWDWDWGRHMPHRDDNEEVTGLEQLSEKLSGGLKRCRTMLHDYQAKLSAISNKIVSPGHALEGGKAHGPE
jgi:hypothetical protein